MCKFCRQVARILVNQDYRHKEGIDLVASKWKLRIPSEKNRPFSDTTLTRSSPWKYSSKASAWTHHPTQCKNQDNHQFSGSCLENLYKISYCF